MIDHLGEKRRRADTARYSYRGTTGYREMLLIFPDPTAPRDAKEHDESVRAMTKINYQMLVKRFAAGDEEAFRSLYLNLYPRLVVAARQVGDHVEVAEEVVQDLFLWVWNNRKQLVGIDSIEEYLYRSTYRNMQRALRRERLWQQRSHSSATVGREPVGQEGPQSFIDRESEDAQRAMVARILATLSPRQRQIVHLRFMEEKSYREISSLLSISEQVLRNLTYRALKKLRKTNTRLPLPLVLLAVGWSLLREALI